MVLVTMLIARSDQAIASPWQALSRGIFMLYAISFFLVFWSVSRLPARFAHGLLLIQGFIATTTSFLIYRLGFGYDPFVHQAAERYLVEHGTLSPPSILYAGYYGIVATFAQITTIDPALIDRTLVPILAPILIFVLIRKTRARWSEAEGRRELLLLPWLIPFLSLTFTVPHNVTYLLLIIAILLLPFWQEKRWLWIGMWLSVWTLLIHPLIGIPLSVLVLSGWLVNRSSRLAVLVAGLFPVGGTIIAFGLYVLQNHGQVLAFEGARMTGALRTLFGLPLFSPDISWSWRLLYSGFAIWPWVLIAVGYFGLRRLPPAHCVWRRILVSLALSVALSALLLAAFVRIPNILPSEQFEFALRLRSTLPIFFLPGLLLAAEYWWPTRLERQVILGILLSVFATAIWYGSYPQFNPVITRSAPGLGKADVAAVKAIEQLSGQKPYVALTPQMVSAAALADIGFEREITTTAGSRYPYPIPTGGELYQQYLRFWYEPDCQVVLQKVANFTSARPIFVVIPHAWDPRGVVRLRVNRCADKREVIDQRYTLFRIK